MTAPGPERRVRTVFIGVLVSLSLAAFTQTFVTVQIELPEEKLDKSGSRDLAVMKKVSTFGYAPLVDAALVTALDQNGVDNPFAKAKELRALISASGAAQVRDTVLANPDLVERFRNGIELAIPDPATFYGGTDKGYTDYPTAK